MFVTRAQLRRWSKEYFGKADLAAAQSDGAARGSVDSGSMWREPLQAIVSLMPAYYLDRGMCARASRGSGLDIFGAQRGGDTTYAGGISAGGLSLTAMPCRLRLPKPLASVRLTLGTASVRELATNGPASFNTASSARTGRSHSNSGEVVTKMFFGAVYRATPVPDEPVGSIKRD
jgi:hypothetical protein